MITLIKSGNVHKYEHACMECGAVFTFNSIDLSHNVIDDEYFIKCPECGRMNKLELDQLKRAR